MIFMSIFNKIIPSKVTNFFLIIILPVLLFSCSKNDNNLPYIHVNFYILLQDPEYSVLNTVGNHIIIHHQGVKGIIIYRKSIDEFTAFDILCTYKPEDRCKAAIDSTNLFLSCPCCNSVFNLPSDGVVSSGPASLPLIQYRTVYDENLQKVNIRN